MKRTEPPSLLSSLNAQMPEATKQAPKQGDATMSTNPEAEQGLSPSVQKHIGNLLKVSFQNLLTEPVPDRFASLLEQLEQAEKKGK